MPPSPGPPLCTFTIRAGRSHPARYEIPSLLSEIPGDELEVSIFSALEEEWEIYFSFGIFYGIVYAKADQVYTLRDEMKQILQAECDKAGEPSDEFIGWFVEKFHVCMPDDIVFNFDLESFLEQMPW